MSIYVNGPPTIDPKALREKAGWTTSEAARRLGVHHSYIGRWESRARAPSPSTLLRMAEVYELAADQLPELARFWDAATK